MAKIKNYDGQTDMELSYVAVQAKEENCGLGRHHGDIYSRWHVGDSLQDAWGCACGPGAVMTSAVPASGRTGAWREAAYRHAEAT